MDKIFYSSQINMNRIKNHSFLSSKKTYCKLYRLFSIFGLKKSFYCMFGHCLNISSF